jgi:nitroreductase
MPHPTHEAIRSRRSVKKFTSHPIDPALLESLLELAMLAPNHRMTEPWGFLILGPEARRAYGEVKGRLRAAKGKGGADPEPLIRKTVEEMEGLPALVAFTQKLDPDPEIREEDYATVYMGIQNFLLGAAAVGLGTHVRTGAALEAPRTREALGIADGERIVALVEVGEPGEEGRTKPRSPVEERIRWLP